MIQRRSEAFTRFQALSPATIWIGSAFILRNARNRTSYRFAVSSGLLSAYLALDDLYQFHDIIGPEYIGIPENAVYLILAITIVMYASTFWRQLLRPDAVLLLISLGLLAASTVLDTILEPMLMRLGRWLVFIEDAAKWLGITSWLAFCIVRCRAEIDGVFRVQPRN